MVGIFSRFSGSRAGHRRTQSTLDQREALPPDSVGKTDSVAAAAAPHGIEIAVEFKPIEAPTEPLDNDQPIHCPLPEPSILNDGRIWKERVSSGIQRKNDMPVMQEQTPVQTPQNHGPVPRPPRVILPSISAPEHNILKLLEECNASGI